ncbi:MAG: hypothetical protein J1E34_10025 [Oscillospiraceae bacterium]|nr:hypothetical protein [Oscillospiraceae bacterium]
MANKTVEALIKCPFFVNEKNNIIACEGYIKNTCMITKFSGAKQKKEHLKKNCYHCTGGACFMAMSLFAKYDKEDD